MRGGGGEGRYHPQPDASQDDTTKAFHTETFFPSYEYAGK